MVIMESRKTARGEFRSLRSDTQLTRAFYKRCGADPMYDHCHKVSALQMQVGITEPKVLLDPRASPERKHVNSVLHNGGLLHTIDPSKISKISVPLPPALNDPDVRELIEGIWLLTTFDRAGAPNSQYASLLNGGSRPSLALLVKLADYAVTHTTEEMLNGLIDPEHKSIFRTYDSKAHAQSCMRNEASAGERIYAPVAELFGYPELAGAIMNHAYRTNHPEIHTQVMAAMADDIFQTRLALTQKMVRQIASHIKAELKRYGFEADVTLRSKKSNGKIMRKVYRMLAAEYDSARELEMISQEVDMALDRIAGGNDSAQKAVCCDSKSCSLEAHIRSAIKGFDFQRLNDWVAARVVLKRYKGREVAGDDSLPFRLARTVIEHALDMQRLIRGCLDINHEQKRGRYNADHFDVKVMVGQRPQVLTPLGHEVQLKTAEWHEMAEHGKAAHYYYLGGDPGFMDAIAKAYHDIIQGSNGICKKESG